MRRDLDALARDEVSQIEDQRARKRLRLSTEKEKRSAETGPSTMQRYVSDAFGLFTFVVVLILCRHPD